jgi:uncharacterized protein YfdQ (DUF2303 family)
MITKEAIDRIVDLGYEMKVDQSGDVPFMVAPPGVQTLNLTPYFPPKFIKERVNVLTGESFIDYVNRYKTGNTMLFADVDDASAAITAIIDYHDPAKLAERCAHKCVFETTETQEWKTWMAANRKAMSQLDFATWLEENMALFNNPDAKPTGAELLELVLSLEGKQHVNFTSTQRLDSGRNRLDYDEEVTLKGSTTTKNGAIELPRELIAGIAPFVGAIKYAVRARLKYRIQGRALSLWFETIAPHVIIRDSVSSVVQTIEAGTKLKAIYGSPM